MKKKNESNIVNIKLDNLLTTQQVSEILGISMLTLNKWRSLAINLPFVKIGKAVRYRSEDIYAFINDNLVEVA